MNSKKLPPIHPGTILKNQFLAPKNLTQAELARSISVSTKRINEICQGKRGITPDTACRLAFYFNLGQEGLEFWINLQQHYEKECWQDFLKTQTKKIREEVKSLRYENYPKEKRNEITRLDINSQNLEGHLEIFLILFYGSLEYLKNMSKLESFQIDNTDVGDSGLEYLPQRLEHFNCLSYKNPEPRVKIIEQELRKYADHPDKMKIVQQEKQIERLTNQLNNKQNQITNLEKKIDSLKAQLTGNQTIIKNLQRDSAITFRTQLNSFDLAGTAGLCLLARHLYRKYKNRPVLQDEERRPLLQQQSERHLNTELNQPRNTFQEQNQIAEIARIISPHEEPKFTAIKQEITRLKYQELAPQFREEKAKFEQLITAVKTKAGNSEKIVDLLLETNKQLIKNNDQLIQGQLIAYQSLLEGNLAKEEIQNLLTKQAEISQLEKHLESLQQNQPQNLQGTAQEAQILQPTYGIPVVLAIGTVAIVFWSKNNPKTPTQKTAKETNYPKIPETTSLPTESNPPITNSTIEKYLPSPEQAQKEIQQIINSHRT
ncbi:9994_t:CDS:2 [Entrophospora sp. SA101]|nr:9994_t:CDS:2 [Entrophospora sp. SA101]